MRWILLVVVAVIGLFVATSAGAVDPDEFEVRISAELLDFPSLEGQTWGQRNSPIVARVNGTPCVSKDLNERNADGDVIIRLGAAGQPAVCSQEGATVSFCVANDVELEIKFILAAGTQRDLNDISTVPNSNNCQPIPTATSTPLPTATPIPPTALPTVNIRPPSTGEAGLVRPRN